MDPNYLNLDPAERVNKILALFSLLIGFASLCAGIIPIAGIIGSVAGLVTGYFGRKSESRNLANIGIVVSSFALTLTLVYMFIVYLSSPK
jgi:ABC-type dipeptide/oligopeptide/nickel transport system permease subunit